MPYTKAWLDYSLHSINDTDTKNKLGYTIFGDYYMDFWEPSKINEASLNTCEKEYCFGIRELLKDNLHKTTKEEATTSFLIEPESFSEKVCGGYQVSFTDGKLIIKAYDGSGILYAVFHLLRMIAKKEPVSNMTGNFIPSHPLRMLNHWDNLDGSIERGYAGQSFFFENDTVIFNERTKEYARLIASVGINAVVINNVNVRFAATDLITTRYFDTLKKMSDLFSSYGIALYLSLNYAAPMELGNLPCSDPLNEDVIKWWNEKMAEVYSHLPKLGGFLVKADSEGRPGPFTYGRDHAQGANMLARAVAPYGGNIIWRCFVYNCKQDWRDKKTDRARSGYDNFAPLDGQFLDNVILQIKNGPMDFQVREPVHPLFGKLQKTNQMLEVQIAQEYTGQQKHVCYLIPMFREILQFKTFMKDVSDDTVEGIISGKSLNQKNCGIAAVANTGNDENWTGHDLAAANLYGFGRLAFDASLSSETIAEEWCKLTYGLDMKVIHTIVDILMRSWPTYENYTSPLGIGWMVNPNHHYGPNVEGYEYDRWGTYHRADFRGIGVDRSDRGTGYATLYNEPNASMYNEIETCPEELLLFFHYIPYTYKLKSGKTLIQHIYDTHFEGARTAKEFVELWKSLEGKIDEKAYARVLERLYIQEESAVEWCDRINTYFYRRCGISDAKGRTIY